MELNAHLIQPQSKQGQQEESVELQDGAERQDNFVDPVDGDGCANTLESLGSVQ